MDVRYLLASLLAAVTLIASDPGDAEEAADPSMIARGSYLARAADCMPCHTSARDKAYAGGLRMNTPFGVMYSPNITPDRETGIGTRTFDEFKKAFGPRRILVRSRTFTPERLLTRLPWPRRGPQHALGRV